MADTNTWLSSLFGGAGSLAGSALTGILSSHAADKSFARTKELMALQQQYSLENWNRENAYNTPAAQMARLKAAGLNPNLVYGSGSAGVSGVAGSIPTPQSAVAPVSSVPDFSSAVGDAVNAAVGIAQAKKSGAEEVGQRLQNLFDEKTLDSRIDSVAKQNSWTDADTNRLKAQTKELYANVDLINQNIVNAIKSGELTDQEIEHLKKQNILVDAQTQGQLLSNEKSQLEINWYPIIADSQVKQALAAANRDNAAAALSAGQLRQLEQTLPLILEGMSTENGQKSLQLVLDKKFGAAERVMGLVKTGVSAACEVLGQFLPAKSATKILGKTVEFFAGGKKETYHYAK